MVTRVEERGANGVAALKALADPLRLSILDVLMEDTARPLTVKEIAARLAEPQTKLYRHIRQLEKAGLITVACTRLVSGIVESRYVAAQEALRLTKGIFSTVCAEQSDQLAELLTAIDLVRDDLAARFPDGRIESGGSARECAGPPDLFTHLTVRVSPRRLLRLRERLGAVLEEFGAESNACEEESVPVTLFSLLYAATPPRSDGTAVR
jgi:DNA-binding transcriptional ArsR family regulator